MAALQDFYKERDQRAEEFEKLKSQAEIQRQKKWSMEAFAEDWNISQFWYSDDTARRLAEQLLSCTQKHNTSDLTLVAVVCAPSVFVQLKNLLTESDWKDGDSERKNFKPRVILLEHDARFEVFGDEFIWYDFKDPLKLPANLKGKADALIIDPPFLSEECQTKMAVTARYLLRGGPRNSQGESGGLIATEESCNRGEIIVCTGERMEALVTGRLYQTLGVHTTDFSVVHANGLSNEFRCYSSFECDEWKWVA